VLSREQRAASSCGCGFRRCRRRTEKRQHASGTKEPVVKSRASPSVICCPAFQAAANAVSSRSDRIVAISGSMDGPDGKPIAADGRLVTIW
jgi:hypothetical protein